MPGISLPRYRSLGFAGVSLALMAVAATGADKPSPGKTQQITSPDQVPEGLQKSDWQNIRAAHKAWEHGFMPVEGQPGNW